MRATDADSGQHCAADGREGYIRLHRAAAVAGGSQHSCQAVGSPLTCSAAGVCCPLLEAVAWFLLRHCRLVAGCHFLGRPHLIDWSWPVLAWVDV